MTCADVERVLPELLDGAPDSAFQSAFEIHLKSCPDCSDLVSDLKLISSAARQMAATEEPAPRVWLRIAAELRSEGLIRDSAPVRPIRAARGRWSAWWLAPVAAAILAAGAYVVNHKSAPNVATQHGPATPVTPPTAVTLPPSSQAVTVEAPQPNVETPKQVAGTAKQPPRINQPPHTNIVEPDSSADDQQFLSVVSTRAPSMRATYEKQLKAVNADIQEVQAYLERNPGDADARQHLMDAYEQKALLYQIALDRIQ
jgi:hypothetical protein